MLPMAVLACVAAGCAAPYKERMAYLDKMTNAGIAYRVDLLRQGTPVSEQACSIGYGLLNPDPPPDMEDGTLTDVWRKQVREAYMKGCLTGQPRPKPEPSGVDAVSPVPNTTPPSAPSPTSPG